MDVKGLCVMLIDDDEDDNFFHQRVIIKTDIVDKAIIFESAIEALEYLRKPASENHPHPNLIFLDINMPKMDGWEFLEEFNQIPLTQIDREAIKIIILSTSFKPYEPKKDGAAGFFNKPLTEEKLRSALEL